MSQRFDKDTELVIVSSHYNEDLEWLRASPFPVIISTNNDLYKHRNCETVFLDERLRSRLNLGREASAYLRFIVQYYDSLPKHIAFIHGHEHAWHQKYPGTLLDAISKAKRHEYDFISLNITRPGPEEMKPGNRNWDIVQDAWPLYFERDVGITIPERIRNLELGAQFVVSRKQILKYPKSVWEKWLGLTKGNIELSFIENGTFYFIPWLFEYTWHIIFGEEPEYNNTSEEYLQQRFNP